MTGILFIQFLVDDCSWISNLLHMRITIFYAFKSLFSDWSMGFTERTPLPPPCFQIPYENEIIWSPMRPNYSIFVG